jgi:SPP1 gp7 family putative phage head morphogenesis protein
LNALYELPTTVSLKKKNTDKVKNAFDNAVKFIHDNAGIQPDDLKKKQVRKLIDEIDKLLSEAIVKGLDAKLKYEIPPEMKKMLRDNVWLFSGMKTWHELKNASMLLITEKGEVKPFYQFKQDVEKINAEYNDNYLQTEYNFAVASSQMAAKWNDFEQDGDRYNLQYLTAKDDKVREDHRALDKTTLPFNDPFWDEYLPPLDWNCRCDTVQVRKNKFPLSDAAEAQELGIKATTRIAADGTNKSAMFRFNPGKDKKIFPNKHPYFAKESSPEDVKRAQKTVEEMKLSNVKELRVWAKENLKGETVSHPECNEKIHFTMTGIKEYLNQPHDHYYEKNEMIKEIIPVLKNSKYMGVTHHKGNTSHIFEIEIQGDKSWLIANVMDGKDKDVVFYSITQSDKVLDKKK